MKWRVVLVGLLALPAAAEVYKVKHLPLIKQQHENLCWAAVSAMASSAFDVPCESRKPSQLDVVFSQKVGSHDLPHRCPVRRHCAAAAFECKPDFDGISMPDPDPLAAGRALCHEDGAQCNVQGFTWLLDLLSRTVGSPPPGNVQFLSAERIRHEIAERNSPVIISWSYINPDTLAGADLLDRLGPGGGLELINRERGDGRHYLIITGFNDSTQEVRVWDPWPAQGVDEPEGHVRHKWIPYERYQQPKIDNGAPVDANHAVDEFAFCRCDPTELESIVANPPPLQQLQAPQIISPINFDFSHDVPQLREERNQAMRARTVRSESGRKMRGRLDTDQGFATVAITTRQLMSARLRPEVLLEPKTIALVIPVMRDRKLVDSFLLINSGQGWREGGYSNNEIARRLTQFRAERGREGRFYLLALPEQGRFYLARGFGVDAQLAPLDGNNHSEFVPATDVLKRLAVEIEHTPAPHPGRPEQPSG